MRVLIADAEHNLTALLRGTLEGSGHAVDLCSEASSLHGSLDRTAPDLLVLDVDLGRGAGVEAATTWRSRPVGGGRTVVLVGGRAESDETVSRAMAALDAHAYLQKPFSLLDFEDLVRRLGPPARPPAPPASGGDRLTDASGVRTFVSQASGPVATADTSARGLRLLARLWATEATGALVRPADGSRVVEMVAGGLVGASGWSAVTAALRSDGLAFEQRATTGEGDSGGLGQRLFQTARRHADISALRGAGARRIAPGVSLERLVELPLHPRTLGVLGGGSGRVSVVLDEAGELEETVAADLAALLALGLASLADASEPVEAEAETSPVEHVVAAPLRSGAGGRQPASAAGPSNGAPSHSQVGAHRGRAAVGRALRSSRRSAVRPAEASAPGGEPARLHRQLKGELERLLEAPPPVVLGIPADSDLELIEQAAERLRHRYTGLAERAGMPTPVRVISRRLAELVEQAHAAMSRRAHEDEMDAFEERATDMAMRPVLSEEERLLEAGEALLAREEWEQADKVLTRARDLCLGHAGILSALAWARLHSPSRPPAARTEEARDLLLLAEQFGGESDARTQRRLARVFLEAGVPDKAKRRIQRALHLEPEAPESLDLERQLAAVEGAPE